MTEPKKPIDTTEFWRKRLLWACATGRGTHTAVYDTSPETWQFIQDDTKRLLENHLKPGMSLLDAGCGYGAASAYLPGNVTYCGVDMSPEMIEVARLAYRKREFHVADLRNLRTVCDAKGRPRHFDFALCRSMRKMVRDNLGPEAWDAIESELLRVADRIIIIEYEDLPMYEVLPDLGVLR